MKDRRPCREEIREEIVMIDFYWDKYRSIQAEGDLSENCGKSNGLSLPRFALTRPPPALVCSCQCSLCLRVPPPRFPKIGASHHLGLSSNPTSSKGPVLVSSLPYYRVSISIITFTTLWSLFV